MRGARFLCTALAGICGIAAALPALSATGPLEEREGGNASGTISLEPPSVASPPRQRSGNPLWAIPLSVLSNTRERPIFSPSRRPPAPPLRVAPRAEPPKAVARPVEQEHLNLILVGTVIGDSDRVGVFLDQASHRFVRLKSGEGHGGWILRSVEARQATLAKGQQTEVLTLPSPRN